MPVYDCFEYKGYSFSKSERSYCSICGKKLLNEEDNIAEALESSICCSWGRDRLA